MSALRGLARTPVEYLALTTHNAAGIIPETEAVCHSHTMLTPTRPKAATVRNGPSTGVTFRG